MSINVYIQKLKIMKYVVAFLVFILLAATQALRVNAEQSNTYVVSQDGSGDFVTIQEGVNAAVSGDTLIIFPGIYEESVEIFNKTINLVGWDRDTCIIKYDSSRYDKAPLIFAAGRVENLTICGYDGKTGRFAYTFPTVSGGIDDTADEIALWQSNFSGYAVHIDSNYLYGKNVYMKNCKIISDNNFCMGIGGRGESYVTLEQCELISYGMGGCIYYHNTKEEITKGNSYFTMDNCVLENYKSPYVFSIHSMGTCNPTYFTFRGTKVMAVAYEDKNVYNLTNMNLMFDVDMTEILENEGMLYADGYYTSSGSKLVNHLDAQESCEYMEQLDNASGIEELPAFREGITYISVAGGGAENNNWYNMPQTLSRKRQVIDIYNNNFLPSDGWCGLNSMYLTPESAGNTLIEMNYPIIN